MEGLEGMTVAALRAARAAEMAEAERRWLQWRDAPHALREYWDALRARAGEHWARAAAIDDELFRRGEAA